MPASTSPSFRVAILGVGVLLLLVVVAGAFRLVRPSTRARTAEPDAAPLGAAAPPEGPAAQARAGVPKFVVTPVALADLDTGGDADVGPEPAAGKDDLSPGERAELDQWQATVRQEAIIKVGLDAQEVAKVAALRERLDAQRTHYEAQIEPGTGMLEPLASAAILGNARTELRQLERTLGRQRAAALRDAEFASYRALLASKAALPSDQPSASLLHRPVALRMLARRLLPRGPSERSTSSARR